MSQMPFASVATDKEIVSSEWRIYAISSMYERNRLYARTDVNLNIITAQ